MKFKLNRLVKGFTLIELLVVIAIISILIAVGSTSYQRASRLSRDSKRKADLEQIRQALETYRSETGAYPAATSSLVSNYIQTMPTDPKSYTYYYNRVSNTQYTLCAYLELPPAGSPACAATVSCSAPGNCNYGTTNP